MMSSSLMTCSIYQSNKYHTFEILRLRVSHDGKAYDSE